MKKMIIVKEDFVKEKVKAELKFLEVSYKHHYDKITSITTEVAYPILEFTSGGIRASLF